MDHLAQLEELLKTSMQQWDVPGVAVALVDDRHVVYANMFGYTRTARVPLMPSPLFQAASLSKPVFAYAVLLLSQRGVFDLDMPLAQVFADPSNIDARANAITARHVLSHTTGFPNWRDEVDQPIVSPQWMPGTRFGYSGEGFEYLQRTVEYLTGQPLVSLVMTTVFERLGMNDSRFGWGITTTGEELLDADGIAAAQGERVIASAAWSLLTTATDYARFLLAMLNPRSDAPSFLDAPTVAAMFTPQVGVGEHAALAWGLGWGIQQTSAGPAFWHWGGPQNEYASYTATLSEQRRGIVILTNGEEGHRVCRAVAEYALGVAQPAFDWILPTESWTPTG